MTERSGEIMPSTSLLDCPFCGAPAEPSRPLKPTIEEAMTAEPHINCSRPKCAGRHVFASIAEWQFRQSNKKLTGGDFDVLVSVWEFVEGCWYYLDKEDARSQENYWDMLRDFDNLLTKLEGK